MENKPSRKSLCVVCGKRLSEKTASGAIKWKVGHVDDTGIYCETCVPPKKDPKGKKKTAK